MVQPRRRARAGGHSGRRSGQAAFGGRAEIPKRRASPPRALARVGAGRTVDAQALEVHEPGLVKLALVACAQSSKSAQTTNNKPREVATPRPRVRPPRRLLRPLPRGSGTDRAVAEARPSAARRAAQGTGWRHPNARRTEVGADGARRGGRLRVGCQVERDGEVRNQRPGLRRRQSAAAKHQRCHQGAPRGGEAATGPPRGRHGVGGRRRKGVHATWRFLVENCGCG